MPTYIDAPIEVDPDALAKIAFDELQARIPGWSPADGNLETILIESIARIASVIGTLASTVPTSIFRFFGPLIGVLPIDASFATAPTTWTLRDTAGYTIPAGTQVGVRTAGDVLVPFAVLADVVVPAGSSATAAGAVTIVALAAGAAGSGLTGPGSAVELIDTLDYVTAIVQTTITTGGVDAETDADYLDRLRSELTLLAPRPILPADFALLAESVAGVDRALAIDGLVPAVNEKQTVSVNGTGGTFTLTYSGQTTAAIAYNATAAAIQAALEALSNIAPGDVAVTGGPVNAATVTVEFTGTLAGANQTQMTADSGSLTGGTHTATIATLVDGAAKLTGQARSIAVAVVDSAGHAPSGSAIAAVQALLRAAREVNFVVNAIAATYTTIDVSYTIEVDAAYDPAVVNAAAAAAIAAFLSPAPGGGPVSGDRRTWVTDVTVRRLDLAGVLKGVAGVSHVDALTLAAEPAGLGTADVTLAGDAPMPLPGTIVGTVA